MKKILIISPCDLPVPAVQGGAVQTLIDSITNSNENEPVFDITVISSYNEEAYKKSENYKKTRYIFIKNSKMIGTVDKFLNKIFEFLDKSRKLRKCNFIWKFYVIKKCREVLKNENYDAVVLQNQGYLTKIFDLDSIRNLYIGKIYYHLHNDIPNSVSKKSLNSCKFILVSDYLSKKIITNYGEKFRPNLLTLNNGIPINKYIHRISLEEKEKLRTDLGFSTTDKVVCFVGRINPDKGILELLQAIQKVNDESIKLLVIGSTEFGNNIKSEFEDEIMKLCDTLGNRVCSTGYVPHENIWKYYQVSDLAALPSIWEEPAGLTILEALISQLPVITTNSGGIPEFMTEDFGYMLERDESLVINIAKAIMEISENMDEWKKKGKKAQQYVIENFSEENYFHNFVKIINQNYKV